MSSSLPSAVSEASAPPAVSTVSTVSAPGSAPVAAVEPVGPFAGGNVPDPVGVPSGRAAYARILGVPGALAFSAAGVIGRFPLSMIGLGIVVLVSARTGSYSAAGVVSAAFMAGNAVGTIPVARLVDRLGQARVLSIATSVSCTALAGLVLAVEAGLPTPWPHVLAALAGLTTPNLGAAVRARWKHVLEPSGERRLLDTAFALEAVNDEVVFVVGPTLTTLLAAAVDPAAGLVTAVVAALAGTWWLAAQRRTEPVAAASTREVAAPMPWAALAPLTLCAAMLGTLFGACEVVTVAFADERGHKAYAGVALGIWAFGSLVAGLVAGALPVRRDAATRHRWGLLVLTAMVVPLPFLPGLASLSAVMLLAGLAISPTLIAAMSWVETTVAPARLNEGLALYSTGLVAGVSPGAALAGVVIDAHGASTAFWVPVAAGAVGVLIAFGTRARRRAPGASVT